jgi:hypothetical protein
MSGYYKINWKLNGMTQSNFVEFGGLDNKTAIYRSNSGVIQISHGNIPLTISSDGGEFVVLKSQMGSDVLPDTLNQYLNKGVSKWYLKTDDGKKFTINVDRSTRTVEILVV